MKLGRLSLVGGILLAGGVVLVRGLDRSPELRAPQPGMVEGVDPTIPDLSPATLAAPVVYDLTRVLTDMEGVVSSVLGDLSVRHDHPDRHRLTVAYEARRGPFRAEMRGEEAWLSATLEYQIRAWYDPPLLQTINVGCGTDEGEPRPRARLELVSPLSLTPDWALRSRARVQRLEPFSDDERDQCRISPLAIDVAGTVMGAARRFLEQNGHRIDNRVAEVDVCFRLQGIWHTLQEPVELTARPRIVLGPRPRFELTEIPPLEEGEVGDDARILLEAYSD